MIVEMAVLEAKAGQEGAMREALQQARSVIARAQGYRGSVFHQGIEKPERFVLAIKWDSVAAHMEGFRQSPLYAEWRSHFGHLLASADVWHYEVVAGEA